MNDAKEKPSDSIAAAKLSFVCSLINQPCYFDHANEPWQIKVIAVVKNEVTFEDEVEFAWAISPIKKTPFGDTNTYKIDQFLQSVRVNEQSQHWTWVEKMKLFLKSCFVFRIEYGSENFQAQITSIDSTGHTVTIKYMKDNASETMGIQSFVERCKDADNEDCTVKNNTAASMESNNDKKDNDAKTLINKNGKKYIGTISEGNEDKGKGIFTCENGIIYEGDFLKNQMHGRGILRFFSPADEYRGEMKNSQKSGHGLYMWANNSSAQYNAYNAYVGSWKMDSRNGYGICTYLNGDKYMGLWLNGNPDGYGTKIDAKGTKVVGYFKEGKIQEETRKVNSDGDRVKSRGGTMDELDSSDSSDDSENSNDENSDDEDSDNALSSSSSSTRKKKDK